MLGNSLIAHLLSGALLLEGVPWSMRGYIGQTSITRYSGIHHIRLHSSRPPHLTKLTGFNHVQSEEACAASELCRRAYRDSSNIHVGPDVLKAALARAVDASLYNYGGISLSHFDVSG